AGDDVDVDAAGSGVQQNHDGARVEPVIYFVGVLQREHVDVHDHGYPAGLRDHAGVVRDLVFFRGDEQDVHGAFGVDAGTRLQDLIVEVHVLDVQRDVLLRLPIDGVGELGVGHHRQRDLFDDDRVSGQR